MGQLFCCRKVDSNQLKQDQYLLQMNRYIKNNNGNYNKKMNIFQNEERIKNNENNNNNLKENLFSFNSKFNMIFYDINRKQKILIERKLEPIKTLEGLSELNFNNNLYLCGSSSFNLETQKGSYFFQLNPFNPVTKILPKTKYSHYYPALISIQKKYIYCIGGKSDHHCEAYNINENKWDPLPNLPEERYLCTLCYDEINNIIYLFGGINDINHLHKNKLSIEYDYFLRLKNNFNYINNNTNVSWEKVHVQNNKILLNRISAASLIFENEENYIYIFGGRDDQGHYLNDAVKFYIDSQSFQVIDQKLDFPTEFLNQYSIKSELNNFLYVFLDKFNNPIIIDKHNYVDFTFDELN